MLAIPTDMISDFIRKARGPYCCFHVSPAGVKFMYTIGWIESADGRPYLRVIARQYWGLS